MTGDAIRAWRHPRAIGVADRCIGRTNLRVDPRKLRRLARRIELTAAAEGLPRIVVTSPLARCAEVGRLLRRRGWTHRIDATLVELDFGAWDGRRWADVSRTALDAWCDDFAGYRPGGGESVDALLERAGSWHPGDARVVVGHAGWICARLWLERGEVGRPTAGDWPAAPRPASCVRLRPPSGQTPASFSTCGSPAMVRMTRSHSCARS